MALHGRHHQRAPAVPLRTIIDGNAERIGWRDHRVRCPFRPMDASRRTDEQNFWRTIMSLLLWPVAIVAFLAWSLAAWLLYGASDWLAAIAGAAMSGILAETLGPWAQWIMASLGDMIQIGIVAIWAIVGLLILVAPLVLRRLRRKPEYAHRSYGYDSYRHDPRAGHDGRDGGWRKHTQQTRFDFDDLRYLASGMVEKYRDKKFQKKRKKWDDD